MLDEVLLYSKDQGKASNMKCSEKCFFFITKIFPVLNKMSIADCQAKPRKGYRYLFFFLIWSYLSNIFICKNKTRLLDSGAQMLPKS